MATTKTIGTLERARDGFNEIKKKLEEEAGGSIEDVHVERYPEMLDNLYKDVRVEGKKLIIEN